ncbi:hypothetical protein Taro_016460 [Colocasia esculenta]|uniref:Translation initiation factor eIF2B subunit epsilon n=1 Tax=Colocasia esculenta TaxID=4460 RepID=A0A843UQ82_COLES|nr:hypothetical protein [Colocasia esculenta]
MSQRRGSRGPGEEPEELARVPLQAVLLADSFTQKFRPITLERPKVLLPLVSVPMIEYSLTWLESVGVQEVFVFCCAHAKQVKDYLEMSGWLNQPRFSVTAIESQDSISAGDALRAIYNKSVIRGDFILISGDTVSNACLRKALEEHKERRKRDPQAIMTMLVKHSKPSYLTHQTRLGNDEIFMAIDPETKQLLYYEDKADDSKAILSLDKTLLSDNSVFCLHNDKQVHPRSRTAILIFALQKFRVFSLTILTINIFAVILSRDYLWMMRGEIIGCHVTNVHASMMMAGLIGNFGKSQVIGVNLDGAMMERAARNIGYQTGAFPVSYFGIPLSRSGDEVILSYSVRIGAFSLIGNGSTIGDNSMISHSVIGEGCTIGRNVLIENSYIWDNVTIEDNCKISYAIVCDGAVLKAGSVLEPGVILSFKDGILLVQLLAYFDLPVPFWIAMRSSTTSLADTSIAEFASFTSEDGASGHAFMWSASEGGNDEEWRHSVAPIPAEKLKESFLHVHADPYSSNQDAHIAPTSGELQPESESTGSSDGEHHKDVDFEGEVEATFRRAVDEGINEENVILEVNSLKLAYNVEHTDCAGALFYAMMKLALTLPHSSQIELLEKTKEVIERWKSLLKHYMKTVDEEMLLCASSSVAGYAVRANNIV